MSVNNNIRKTAYGFSDPLLNVSPAPIVAQRNPTTNDKAPVGQLWVNELTNTYYVLTSVTGGSATWTSVTTGSVNTLTGDIGGAVGPNAGNINILGGGSILVSGNPGTNTLTIGVTDVVADSFLTDAGTATPITGVIDIAGTININTSALGNVVSIHLNDSIQQPDTSPDETAGMYSLGGNRFLHNLGTRNVFLGSLAGNLALSAAQANVFVGTLAANAITTASSGVGIGDNALTNLLSGDGNTCIGNASGGEITTGGSNTAIGNISLDSIITGSNNIGIGFAAGTNYTGAESSNIIIGNFGTLGESNVIRIGTQGAGAGQQHSCFIAGISGVTVASSAAVLINTGTGELGTAASSRRFKENIVDMANESSSLLDLRPVNFNFKSDSTKSKQFGLIAEEVYELFPDLVNLDQEGIPASVRYHDLPVILLNEIKKLVARIEKLESK